MPRSEEAAALMFGLPASTTFLVFGFPALWTLYTLAFLYVSRGWSRSSAAEDDEGERA